MFTRTSFIFENLSVIFLTASVTDGKFKVEVPFRIKVLDSNDEYPVFLKKEYFFGIHENSSNKTSVGIVQTLDSDLNDTATYSIVSGLL